MYLSLYSSKKDKIIFSIIFGLSLLLTLGSIEILISNKFSLVLLSISLSLMIITGVCFFYFFRFMFCPVVQVYKKRVIISRLKRFDLGIKEIKTFEVDKNNVHLIFVDKNKQRDLKFQCTHRYELESLKLIEVFLKRGFFGELKIDSTLDDEDIEL